MEYPLAQFFDGKLNPVFFEDLHAETGECDGLEWFALYEVRHHVLHDQRRILYVKVVITSEKGRQLASLGANTLLHRCNIRGMDLIIFHRGLVLAISDWDNAHPMKSSPPPDEPGDEERELT